MSKPISMRIHQRPPPLVIYPPQGNSYNRISSSYRPMTASGTKSAPEIYSKMNPQAPFFCPPSTPTSSTIIEPLSAVSAPADCGSTTSKSKISESLDNQGYSRIFNPRLLGFTKTDSDPASIVSYCPNSGFSYTIWTPPTTNSATPKAFSKSSLPTSEIYIDSSCILLSIAGRHDSASNELTYAVFHGPGSRHNLVGKLPLTIAERTRRRLHAELYACETALKQMRDIARSGDSLPTTLRNLVIVTHSRRIMHAVVTCAAQWESSGWTRARGRKTVPNAAAWRRIIQMVQELERMSICVRFWTVEEAKNRDAVNMTANINKTARVIGEDKGYQGSSGGGMGPSTSACGYCAAPVTSPAVSVDVDVDSPHQPQRTPVKEPMYSYMPQQQQTMFPMSPYHHMSPLTYGGDGYFRAVQQQVQWVPVSVMIPVYGNNPIIPNTPIPMPVMPGTPKGSWPLSPITR